MKTNKKSFLFGILSWVCLVAILFIAKNKAFYIAVTMTSTCLFLCLLVCSVSLLSKKYKDGTQIPFNRKVEWCVNTMWMTGSVGLFCFFGFLFLEQKMGESKQERELTTYAPRLVTVKTAFEGKDSIELQILASWEYGPFNVGEKVNLYRIFWSGDNSLNKVTRDMFISPSVDHDRNDVWISRYCNKKDSLLERISISETVAYHTYRYTVSKKAIILYDPKLDQ